MEIYSSDLRMGGSDLYLCFGALGQGNVEGNGENYYEMTVVA